MQNKELLNNIIAITAGRSAIAHIKYSYEDVVKIAETYAIKSNVFKPVWVDVKISLPPLSGKYLGLMKETLDQYICFYRKDRNLFQVYGAGVDPISDMSVTHWMPLPDAPVTDNNNPYK